jgi:phosphoenolpyruvate-protein kinase (PTS system EI component)
VLAKANEIGRSEDVMICGEVASDPRNVSLLLEMGYRSLSISPVVAEDIRAAVEKIQL